MNVLFSMMGFKYDVKQDENGKYFIVSCDTGRVLDVQKGLEVVGDGYITTKTKNKIIAGLEEFAKNHWKEERRPLAQQVLDAYHLSENSKSESTPKENEVDNSELVNELSQIKNLLKEQNSKPNLFEQAMIEGIISKGKELATEDLKNEIKSYLQEFVKDTYGVLPSVIQIKKDDSTTEFIGSYHKLFEKILKIVTTKVPLMLVGPAGSGKNHTLEQVAEVMELDFYFSNAITQEYKLTGFVDANGNYVETEFYKAFSKGGLFFFDEIDASSPEALIVVNAALANGYFDFPNGRIDAHENFRVVAAANTFGHGASMIYVGRNQLDGATLDRFVVMEFDYDEQIERSLAFDSELYDFISDLRSAIDKSGLRYIVSMRATINSTKLLKAGLDKATVLKTVITKAMTKDDLNSIQRHFNVSNSWTKLIKEVR